MPGLLSSMPKSADRKKFLNVLQQVIYCHQSQKNNEFTQNMPLDFKIIRNTMYKYSRAAVDVFMNGGAELTFIFAWFVKS